MFSAFEQSRHQSQPVTLYLFEGVDQTTLGFNGGSFGRHGFCDGEAPIVRDGITYQPWPISRGDLTSSGTLDKSNVTVTMGRGSPFESEFLGFPMSIVVNLTIFQGHIGDDLSLPANCPAIWVGRATSPTFSKTTLEFSGIPVSTSLKQPGLRRHYQIGCPHALYGPQCKASKTAGNATVTRTVTGFSGNTLSFAGALPRLRGKYAGGMIEWSVGTMRVVRSIISASEDRLSITARGNLKGLVIGSQVSLSIGCNRQQSDCLDQHNNILNYGGQPNIPLANPLSQKNIFV